MYLQDLLVALTLPVFCLAFPQILPGGPADLDFFNANVLKYYTSKALLGFSLPNGWEKTREGNKGGSVCSGSLLNANTVVTAAHCIGSRTGSGWMAYVGGDIKSEGTHVSVSSIKIHPGFKASTREADIAILKLSTPIPTSSTVSYAILPESDSEPVAGITATIAGMGSPSGDSTLQQVDVTVLSHDTCRANSGNLPITPDMFCASVQSKDTCQEDSGGPLIVKSTGVLIGITSFGISCAAPQLPGLYTRVSAVLDFINTNL